MITSDWQCDADTIPLCQQVIDEILELKQRLGFSILIHCGDVKHAYDPIRVAVLNFIVRAVSKLVKNGLDVYIDLGNHDRQGMYVDTKNWFPALRKAGSQAFDKPAVVSLGHDNYHGHDIRFLPFRHDVEQLKKDAKDLAKSATKNSLLIFHADLCGASYDVLNKSTKGIAVEDLHPNRYAACIGGHFHWQQRVQDNVWYCGSPFCTDWGEANQRKGYLLYDFDTHEVKRVRSKIPGWYDPSWPNFPTNGQDWQGTRIRLHVPVADARSVMESLDAAREKSEKLYAGADITLLADFKEAEPTKVKIHSDWPDARKLESYIQTTLPEKLRVHKEKVLQYLVEQLNQAGGLLREGRELKFKGFEGENVLSFKKVSFKIDPGLTVVSGVNHDWRRRSNGSGKSSFLSVIAISLCGVTFKGQKHDHWRRRGTKASEQAYVSTLMQDAQDREVSVWRGRQPNELRLKVNGESVESGNRPEQIQRSIEQITGYTWETLSNAIYVDQTRAHLLLTGTEAQRKQFLARLQNLERFERAQKSVKSQKTDIEERVQNCRVKAATATAKAEELSGAIKQAEKLLGDSLERELEDAKREYDKTTKAVELWRADMEKNVRELERKREELRILQGRTYSSHGQCLQKIRDLSERLSHFSNTGSLHCPTCLQAVSQAYAAKQRRFLESDLVAYRKRLKELEQLKDRQIKSARSLEHDLASYSSNAELESRALEAKQELDRVKFKLEEQGKQKRFIAELNAKRSKELVTASEQERKITKFERWLRVLDYAETVFARNGLPAYLNAQIIPELNEKAAQYSELFSQKEIQVIFKVDEEGCLDVQVINVHGGERVQDQSEGEMKIASLIVSFAVRAIAPKTNLLILDEPGDGLDSTSARQFARGLKQVVRQFGSILCVTHNDHILSELADAKHVVIEKKNLVSRISDEKTA